MIRSCDKNRRHNGASTFPMSVCVELRDSAEKNPLIIILTTIIILELNVRGAVVVQWGATARVQPVHWMSADRAPGGCCVRCVSPALTSS